MLVPARATPKPSWRFASSSMVTSDAAERELLEEIEPRAERDGKLQPRDERQAAEDHQADREPDRGLELEVLAADAGDDHHEQAHDDHAGDLEPEPEHDDGHEDPEDGHPVEL